MRWMLCGFLRARFPSGPDHSASDNNELPWQAAKASPRRSPSMARLASGSGSGCRPGCSNGFGARPPDIPARCRRATGRRRASAAPAASVVQPVERFLDRDVEGFRVGVALGRNFQPLMEPLGQLRDRDLVVVAQRLPRHHQRQRMAVEKLRSPSPPARPRRRDPIRRRAAPPPRRRAGRRAPRVAAFPVQSATRLVTRWSMQSGCCSWCCNSPSRAGSSILSWIKSQRPPSAFRAPSTQSMPSSALSGTSISSRAPSRARLLRAVPSEVASTSQTPR